jgi:5-methylcytosine-specific restriction endonuclease McrA
MKYKHFIQLLGRDSYCLHCGLDDDTLIIQHRSNKGFGGSKRLDNTANLMILCSSFNNLIESDAKAAGLAKRFGYKISRYDNPLEMPIYDVVTGIWYLLKDDWTREQLIQ